jgi:tetratricopeptide (TPR) repeat protein
MMAFKTNRLRRIYSAALQACTYLVILAAISHFLYAADQSADVSMANRYLQAAKNGDVKAEFYTGALYSAGVGVSPSDAEAFRWFLRAAEHGNSEARIIVGASYAIGRGVPRNYTEAYKWTFVAAASADLPETRNGARQLLDVLIVRMSDHDIAEARKQAQSILTSTNSRPTSPQTALPTQPAPSNDNRNEQHIAVTESPRGAEYDRLTNDIEREPSNTEAYVKRGGILVQRGEYALADQDLSKAILLDSNNARAFNNRCWARLMLGQTETAVADCNKAVELQPDYVDALDSRGLANLKLGRFDRAVSDFNAALRLKPKLASSLYGRGIANTHLGNKSSAGVDIDSALAIDPKIKDQFVRYGIH